MKKFRLSIYDTENLVLRGWLVKKRKEMNLTQRQLAEKLQTVHSLVGKVEKGERGLDVIEFFKYCNALNANPNELLNLIENLTTPQNN